MNGHSSRSEMGKRSARERADGGVVYDGSDSDDGVDITGESGQQNGRLAAPPRKRIREDNYSAQGGAVANFVSQQYMPNAQRMTTTATTRKPLSADDPALEILEQPRARGFRFRYPCEGPCHGELRGENSEPRMKTYPSVKLHGVQTRARILVSLVCHDDPVRPHAHCLVGKNVLAGQCSVEVGRETNWTAAFPRLSILHIPKKNAARVLLERYALMKDSVSSTTADSESLNGGKPKPREELDSQVDKSKYDDKMALELQLLPGAREQLTGGAAALAALDEDARRQLEECAAEQARTMNLNVVRLCFQAFLPDPSGAFTRPLEPKLSHPVYDTKASSSSALRICRLDRHSGSALGGDVIFMLCDRVQKDDITIRFFEERSLDTSKGDVNGDTDYQWEADGEFSVNDVHRQSAIVFKTPPYWKSNISRPVKVWIALKRRSEEEFGEPHPFTYLPPDACSCSCKGSTGGAVKLSIPTAPLTKSVSFPSLHNGGVEKSVATPVMPTATPIAISAGGVTSPVLANPANGMYYFYPQVGLPHNAMAIPGPHHVPTSPYTTMPSIGVPFYPAASPMVACTGGPPTMVTSPGQLHPTMMAPGLVQPKQDVVMANT